MIIGFIGIMGSGKTLSAVIESYIAYRMNCTIFSTMPLNFDHVPIKTAEDFLKCKNGVLLADELWYLLDSRFSMSTRNKVLSVILLRARKQNLHVFYTEQYYKQLDIRIRRNTNLYVLTTMYPYLDINQSKKYIQNGGHFTLEQDIYIDDELIKTRYIYNVERFFDLFNTNQDPYILEPSKFNLKALQLSEEDFL